MPDFDLAGVLRRVRRTADLSQRQLADALGVSQSTVARAEAGRRDITVGLLVRAADLADLRVALLSEDGSEVTGMSGAAVRDHGGRRFPAHLDTRYGDEDWWHGDERYSREQPWYTFDRARWLRDRWRERLGTPGDHQLPQPGDSPEERRAARQREARRRRQEEFQRRLAAGEITRPELWDCTCPPECDELDDYEGPPVHAPDCGCQCDIG